MPTISPRRTVRLASVDDGAGVVERVHDGPVADLEEHLADRRAVRREAVLEVAADHPADDPVLVDAAVGDVEGLDGPAVADDRDASAICSISLSLWQIMMQVMPLRLQARRAGRAGAAESSSLSAAVGSSRISSLTSLDERLGDLDELLLADAEVLDRGQRVLAQADPGEQLDGLAVGAVPVDDPARERSRCRGRCSRRSTARGSAPAPGG